MENLHSEYISYVRICVQTMLDNRRLSLRLSEKQAFFPPSIVLTSQIEKNARSHAIQVVSTWAKARYALKLKGLITKLKRAGEISPEGAKALYTIGKYLKDQPSVGVSQTDIDLFWKLLDEKGGRKPVLSDSAPMMLTEMTSRLENPDPDGAVLADYWLRLSALEARKNLWLPIVGNPYVTDPSHVSKGIMARKTRNGRWRFEAVEKQETVVLEPADMPATAPKLGVDVGLNVLAATSDGCLYGLEFKPNFNRLYDTVKTLRSNRQRQGLKENSGRLDCLESRLSGMIKTETGRIANLLVNRHPNTIFVVEDLDLSGCRGQKRFAYRALHKALSAKAPVEVVNPAYTSQECPSCGFVSRKNRKGTKFQCISCGRKCHADWVGASGILRRSGDQSIGCADHPLSVKATLLRRYTERRKAPRISPARSLAPFGEPNSEPEPLGRSLTTGVPASAGAGTGLNLVPV
jgi:predicted RNA-binding Zn-ribbon protein involved in translation (DUF1610 family)